METKDSVDEFIRAKDKNRIRCSIAMKEEKDRKEIDDNDIISPVDETSLVNDCFNLEQWMKEHPKVTFKKMCNFSSEELDELVSILENSVKTHSRGRKRKISTKGELFVTLSMFSANTTYELTASLFSLSRSTFHDIVDKVVNKYFPVFIDKFIPKSIPICSKEFINFPDAIGAVDSTTIPFYCPIDVDEKRASWDGKNHINGLKLQALVNPSGKAIHLNAEYNASVHDKKLFDISGIIEFITVKRGKMEKSLPVLADKGYAGINSYLPDSLVMKKGPENKEFNDSLASDRQIVERYFGRLKMTWSVLITGYRGDKGDKLKLIVLGLASLTNYLIDMHPLTKDDDLKENDDSELIKKKPTQISLPKKQRKFRASLKKLVPKNAPYFKLPVSNSFVGIRNQGATCHLNVTLQLLFSFPDVVEMITRGKDIEISPMHEIYCLFELLTNTENAIQYAVTTHDLILSIGKHFLQARDLRDTLSDIITFLDANFKAIPDVNFSISQLYTVNKGTVGHEYGIFNVRDNSVSVEDQIRKSRTILPKEKRSFGKLIFVEAYRQPETVAYKHYNTKINFEQELNLDDFSTSENKRFHLVGVIAYSNFHFIFFKKIKEQWYILNDDICYTCNEEHIKCLSGGEGCELLWNLTQEYKWVARLLIYS